MKNTVYIFWSLILLLIIMIICIPLGLLYKLWGVLEDILWRFRLTFTTADVKSFSDYLKYTDNSYRIYLLKKLNKRIAKLNYKINKV